MPRDLRCELVPTRGTLCTPRAPYAASRRTAATGRGPAGHAPPRASAARVARMCAEPAGHAAPSAIGYPCLVCVVRRCVMPKRKATTPPDACNATSLHGRRRRLESPPPSRAVANVKLLHLLLVAHKSPPPSFALHCAAAAENSGIGGSSPAHPSPASFQSPPVESLLPDLPLSFPWIPCADSRHCCRALRPRTPADGHPVRRQGARR
jgi:hypothetical protein